MSHTSVFVRPLAALALCLAVSAGGSPQEPPKPEMPQTLAWHVLFGMGPKYDPKVDIKEAPGFEDHFKRVHKLADEGTLLIGGPLVEGFNGGKLTGAVMVIRGRDEKSIRDLLAPDAFISGGVIQIESVRPLVIGAGAWIRPAPTKAQPPK